MAPDLMLILLQFVVSVSSLKYVYVEDSFTWEDAQRHCRKVYTDLAPVSNKYDMKLLKKAFKKFFPYSYRQKKIWFGLMRNATDADKWMWSGGAGVTMEFWDVRCPDCTDMFGLLDNFKWREASPFGKLHSLCYQVHVVRERKTWEEALEFCRENHQDLASVASDTEMMLMQRELQKEEKATEHVWVGLRFLAGEWLWVDGQPLEYEAWGPNEQTRCPQVGCGALRVTGTRGDTCESVIQAGNVEEWYLVDCSERLHFLCY